VLNGLEQRVFENIRKRRMLAAGDRAGVAVSGGADSVALLRLLGRLKEKLGITLVVVHFDHRLRGAESDGDAQFVAELAKAQGLESMAASGEVEAAAAANKWNIEDAARRLRYAFFERVVREGRATRIAVAHTADDQAETILAHLFRGTGPAGLAGIYPAIGSVVRPLLEERREDLRKYLRDTGEAWREDSTNMDVRRMRARVRSRLLPLIEQEFSPGIVDHLSSLARLMREQETFWEALIEDRVRTLIQPAPVGLRISIRDLLAPLALAAPAAAPPRGGQEALNWTQRTLTERLVRGLYQQLRGSREGLTAAQVEQVIQLASGRNGGRRIELPGGIVAERSFQEMIFRADSRRVHQKRARAQGPEYQYVVALPSCGSATVCVAELNRRFRLKVIDWTVAERETKREGIALDLDALRSPLLLRSWQPGDAYRPVGRRSIQKLKRMFLAGRIPSAERARWPVIESGGRVVWACGLPPAGDFCAHENTRVGVLIEEAGA
jgi:tRNA(Ile)-lysidine synthase